MEDIPTCILSQTQHLKNTQELFTVSSLSFPLKLHEASREIPHRSNWSCSYQKLHSMEKVSKEAWLRILRACWALWDQWEGCSSSVLIKKLLSPYSFLFLSSSSASSIYRSLEPVVSSSRSFCGSRSSLNLPQPNPTQYDKALLMGAHELSPTKKYLNVSLNSIGIKVFEVVWTFINTSAHSGPRATTASPLVPWQSDHKRWENSCNENIRSAAASFFWPSRRNNRGSYFFLPHCVFSPVQAREVSVPFSVKLSALKLDWPLCLPLCCRNF